ncbi:MAG: GumC family protein [Hyphomicrobiales bacterium]
MNEFKVIADRTPQGEAFADSRGGIPQTFDAREIASSLMMQIRTIVVAALLVLTAAVLVVWQIERKYSATALLEIDQSEAEMVGMGQKGMAGTTLNSLVETKVEILNSSSVSLTVIKSQKLWRDEEFGLGTSSWKDFLSLLQFSTEAVQTPEIAAFEDLTGRQRAALVDKLDRRVGVARRGLTSVIAVTARSVSPEKAATLANALANAYIDLEIGTRVNSAQRAAEFLEVQLNLLAEEIKKGDAEISRLILENSGKIGTAETQALLDSFKTRVASLDLERTRLLAQASRLQAVTESNDFTEAALINLGADFGQQVARRNTLAAAVAQGDVSLKAQLAQAEQELRATALDHLSAIDKQVQGRDSELSKIRKSIEDTIGSQTIPPELAIGLYRLQKEALNNQRLYDSYAARLGDAQQMVGLPISSSRLVAPAMPPDQPDWPSRTLLLVLAALAASGMGVAAGLLRHYYIGGFTSAMQLEAVGGHQVIANVLECDGDPAIVAVQAPNSAFVESIRRVRIGIESGSPADEGRMILVTSTEPGEGKTTVATSLARSFAQSGRRTLLLDGDLRRPSIAKHFGVKESADLIDAIMANPGDSDLSKFVWHDPATGLDVLCAGERGDVASDMILGSERFRSVAERALQNYEIVIVDSPPVGQVVDALVLQRSADVILYVVRNGTTGQREVAAGVKQMERQAVAPPLYFVLNRASNMLTGYGYSGAGYAYY